MPATGQLLAFALISLALIVVPGPNVLFVISRSLTLGRAAGVGTAAGGVIGEFVQVTAVAFGMGALVERSLVLFTAIKLAGAAYLEGYAKLSLKKYRPIAARNDDKNVLRGRL